MLAALTLAGWPGGRQPRLRRRRNVLAGVTNASAVLIFAFSRDVRWASDLAVILGAIIGGRAGAWMVLRVSESCARRGVVVLESASRSGCLSNKSFFFGEEGGAGPGAATFFAATARRLHSPAFFDVGLSLGRSACSLKARAATAAGGSALNRLDGRATIASRRELPRGSRRAQRGLEPAAQNACVLAPANPSGDGCQKDRSYLSSCSINQPFASRHQHSAPCGLPRLQRRMGGSCVVQRERLARARLHRAASDHGEQVARHALEV